MIRRQLLKNLTITATGVGISSMVRKETHIQPTPKKPFTFCLNTSTIRGQKQGLVKDLETASDAGYDGVEIWISDLQDYIEQGGTLQDLKMRLEDLDLTVEDAIGFAQWIVDDDHVRTQAHEQLKREMDLLAGIGCARIAAPPAGATKEGGLDLDAAAERYAAVLDLGVKHGVIPQLEVWGFSNNLHKISQVLYVAAESGHAAARILPDVYHLFKGGSDFDALKLIKGSVIEIFHMSDYPSSPSREKMQDSDRVYPGDGVGPVLDVLRDLYKSNETTVLSLELFNPNYWKEDARTVAKKGLDKMKASVIDAII